MYFTVNYRKEIDEDPIKPSRLLMQKSPLNADRRVVDGNHRTCGCEAILVGFTMAPVT